MHHLWTRISNVVSLLASALALLCAANAYAQDKSVVTISEGEPKGLPSINMRKFEVRQLAKPIPWWVNYDSLRRRGIKIPPRGLADPSFSQQVKQAWGWQVPYKDDPESAFTGAVKWFWATFYGGFGTARNMGDARAGRAGQIDIKGIGQTPMLNSTEVFHSNGAAKSIEGIDEAIQAGILGAIEPYGANEMLGVLFTNTFATLEHDGQREVFGRSLIVRDISLRPAHWLHNIRIPQRFGEEFEKQRLEEMHKTFQFALPHPAGFVSSTPARDIGDGLRELFRRWGAQMAVMVANRHYIGSSSPSNLEIDGKILDLGGASQVPGYTRMRRLSDEGGFGENYSHHDVFDDMIDSWNEELPAPLRAHLPTKEEMRKIYDAEYDLWLRRYMVLMSGTPDEIGRALEGTAEHRDLAEALKAVAFAGNDVDVWQDDNGTRNSSDYDFAKVVKRLSEIKEPSIISCKVALEQLIPARLKGAAASKLMARLARAYSRYAEAERARARLDGISNESLQLYKREAARMRTKEMVGMDRGHKRFGELWAVESEGIKKGDHVDVSSFIDKHIYSNIRFYHDAAPYQIVIGEKVSPELGIHVRHVYDAKVGEYGNVLRIHVANGEGQFFGWGYKVSDLAEARLSYLDASGMRRETRPVRNGEYLDFPMPRTIDARPGELQLIERDGSRREAKFLELPDYSLRPLAPPPLPCVTRALRAS